MELYEEDYDEEGEKYYRIGIDVWHGRELQIRYYNASTHDFQDAQIGSSRYHEDEVEEALEEIRHHFPKAYRTSDLVGE